MQASLPKEVYDHELGMHGGLETGKVAVLNPYGLLSSDNHIWAVFAIGVVSAKERPILNDDTMIKARFPMGLHHGKIDVPELLSGLRKSRFKVMRLMREIEYVGVYPEILNHDASGLFETGKKTLLFPALKFFPQIYRYPIDEKLYCTITGAILTKLPKDKPVWEPPYYGLAHKMQSLMAVGLGVHLRLGVDQVEHAYVQIPLGFMSASSMSREEMTNALKTVKGMNPKVSVGAVHGISVHVILRGKIPHILKAFLRGKTHLVMPVSTTLPAVNFAKCIGAVMLEGVTVYAAPAIPATAMVMGTLEQELTDEYKKL